MSGVFSLTVHQQRVLRFIAGFVEAHGRPPTYREIARGAALRNKANAWYIVQGLLERGHIPRRGDLRPTRPVAIPRAPDGAPLYFVSPFDPSGQTPAPGMAAQRTLAEPAPSAERPTGQTR